MKNQLSRYIVGRVSQALVVVVGVVTLTFLIARVVPGDPARIYAGPRATPDEIAQVRAQFGLDEPILQQLARYANGLIRGDWGISLHTRAPVLDDLARAVPASLELVTSALLLASIVGVPMGIFAAKYKGRLGDLIVRLISIFAVSMPVFFLAIILQTVFFSQLQWFPVAGQYDAELDYSNPLATLTGMPVLDSLISGNWPVFTSVVSHLVLPAVALAAYPFGAITLSTRAAMLNSLGEEHVQMMRALGFAERIVLGKFALRPSMSPVISIVALIFAYSLVNSFLVEAVFNWSGLGSYAVKSISTIDIPAITGITLLVALIYVVLNFLVDVLQMIIDPRTRP